MKQARKLISLILILATPPALANIDLLRAGFILSEKDQLSVTSEHELTIERTYHSRSLHRGLWGFGWCSVLEWTLDVKDPDLPELKKCDQDHARAPVSNDPDPSGDFVETYATKIENKYLIHHGSLKLWFTQTGRLAAWQAKDKALVLILYDDKIPTSLISQGILYQIRRNGPFISTLEKGEKTINYSYDGQRLVAMTSGAQRAEYHYSERENLIQYSSSTHGEGQVTYQENLDQVMGWERSSGCRFEITYQGDLDQLELEYKDTCPNSETLEKLSLNLKKWRPGAEADSKLQYIKNN